VGTIFDSHLLTKQIFTILPEIPKLRIQQILYNTKNIRCSLHTQQSTATITAATTIATTNAHNK